MNTNKFKTIMLAVFLGLSINATADDYAYLTIDQTQGASNYAISGIGKITFEANDMVIHLTDGTEARLPLSGVSKMFFTKDATSIGTIGQEQSRFAIKDGMLHVTAPQGTMVTIYDLEGKTIRTITTKDTETEVNMNNMGKGVYIVKAGKDAKKVMNK